MADADARRLARAARERRVHWRHRRRDRRDRSRVRSASRFSSTPRRTCPDNRFNDGKVDRQGRFWAGTMDDRSGERQRHALSRRSETLAGTRSTAAIESPMARRSARDGEHHVPQRFARGRSPTSSISTTTGSPANRRDLPPIRRGRRLSRRNDRRCRRLPVDRLLGRLVRPPLFAQAASGWRRIKMPGRSGRPAARSAAPTSTGSTSPRRASGLDRSALAMQPNAGGLFMVTPGVRGLDDAPFAG